MSSYARIVGLEQFDRNIAKLGAVLSNILETAAMAGAMPIQNDAKARAPKRTRTLARGIHMETVSKTSRSVWVAVGPREIYGRIHELGGTIVPRKARVLAWVTSGARPRDAAGWREARRKGIARFAMRTTIRAKPYLKPAFEAQKAKAVAEARDVLRQKILEALPK